MFWLDVNSAYIKDACIHMHTQIKIYKNQKCILIIHIKKSISLRLRFNAATLVESHLHCSQSG